MTKYLYEFLYRGNNPNDSNSHAAYHIVIRDTETNIEQIMNIQQAQDAGFDLPHLISDINSALLASVDILTNQLAKGEENEA